MAESVVGDIPTFAGVPKETKHERERMGFDYIVGLLKPGYPNLADELLSTWLDYEWGRTPEGLWMKEMDKFECLVQAKEYEERTFGEQKGLDEFQGLLKHMASPDAKSDVSKALDHCKHLTQIRSLEIVTLQEIVDKKCEEKGYVYSDVLQKGRKLGIDPPNGLVVQLLESRINEVHSAAKWALVCGFPAHLAHLVEFERKVRFNHALAPSTLI
ncbi:hypothetical protein QQZ08_010552 [Neonectria magnoliae]|uniref:HD domain-containing protein n=1 Tax=Neonectria magnoliae TaxID=2732573 RepID=A0ABR1HHB3_9HYPO